MSSRVACLQQSVESIGADTPLPQTIGHGVCQHSALKCSCLPGAAQTGFFVRVSYQDGDTFDIGDVCKVGRPAPGARFTGGLDGATVLFCGMVYSAASRMPCALVHLPHANHTTGVLTAVPMSALTRAQGQVPGESLASLMGRLQAFHAGGARFDSLGQPQARSFLRTFYLDAEDRAVQVPSKEGYFKYEKESGGSGFDALDLTGSPGQTDTATETRRRTRRSGSGNQTTPAAQQRAQQKALPKKQQQRQQQQKKRPRHDDASIDGTSDDSSDEEPTQPPLPRGCAPRRVGTRQGRAADREKPAAEPVQPPAKQKRGAAGGGAAAGISGNAAPQAPAASPGKAELKARLAQQEEALKQMQDQVQLLLTRQQAAAAAAPQPPPPPPPQQAAAAAPHGYAGHIPHAGASHLQAAGSGLSGQYTGQVVYLSINNFGPGAHQPPPPYQHL